MRVFLYEFITGGGLLNSAQWSAEGSLLREGSAMIRALAADFAALPGAEVTLLCDYRAADLSCPGCRVQVVSTPADEQRVFERCAAAADWTVVIAPEIDGALLRRCRQVLASGGRLLGPGPDVVELASDKYACNQHLRAHGVPVPPSRLLERGDALPLDGPYPAVLKPVDGAGSQGLRLLSEPGPHSSPLPEYRESGHQATAAVVESRSVIEQFMPGIPASVAVLCGPAGHVALTPCRQHLSQDGRLAYLGGSLPLPDHLAERARQLAERAIATLPSPLGYLGVDLVLGADPRGGDDCVIEINPRLTTSYVGLRAAAETSLAQALLDIAIGRRYDPTFRKNPLSFTSGGEVCRNHGPVF